MNACRGTRISASAIGGGAWARGGSMQGALPRPKAVQAAGGRGSHRAGGNGTKAYSAPDTGADGGGEALSLVPAVAVVHRRDLCVTARVGVSTVRT
ncbi:hypothetical protein GCM10010417_04750 [Streptomyces carpaticus]